MRSASPKNDCALFHLIEGLEQILRSRCGTFEQRPLGSGLLADKIEIPAQADFGSTV